MLKIAHLYPYECKNAGDIYLVWSVKKMFNPIEWIDINCKQIFDKNLINTINTCDAVLIGGGGLILPDSFNFTSPTGWQVGIPTELISCIKPPIIVYAIGWNLFRNQQPSIDLLPNISEMTNRSAFFSLRHTGDIDKLEGYTGIKNKIKLNFCPSIVSEPFKLIKSNKIAFQLAGDRLETRVGSVQEFIKNIGLVCSSFSNKYFVAHTVGDLKLHDKLANDFGGEFVNLVGQKPEVIRDFYYTIDTVFTMRGHGQMIPLGLGCKIVSLISHDKILNLLKDLDITNTGVEVQDADFIGKCLEAYEIAKKTDFYSRRKIVEENIKNNLEIISWLLHIKI